MQFLGTVPMGKQSKPGRSSGPMVMSASHDPARGAKAGFSCSDGCFGSGVQVLVEERSHIKWAFALVRRGTAGV
ncbi:MAG: hypothetical protein ACLT98_07945 [Eggerthellaceae bacterium]